MARCKSSVHHRFSSILFGYVMLLALAAQAQAMRTGPSQSLPTPAYDNSRQLLQVGMIDFAPYSYIDDSDQPAGLYIPLITKIAENAGYQVEFRILPIARLVQGLQDGTVHLWPGIEGKPELAEHAWVSRHRLGSLSVNLYYLSRPRPPEWPEDLRGESLILLSGYDYWPTVRSVISDPANRITVQRTQSHGGAIGMLERGRARFLLNYHAPMQQALKSRPDLKLQYQTLQRIPLRMIVSRQSSMGSRSLMEKLDLSYEQLASQGEHLVLQENWAP